MLASQLDAALGGPDGSRARILIVDGLPGRHPALERALRPLPVQRVVAHSPEEAVSLLSRGDFAAAVVDALPAARRIREQDGVPVLYLADPGVTLPEDLGAVDVVPMPVDAAALRAKIGFLVELYKRSREARESSARCEAITEASLVGLFQTDVEGRCLYVNPRWCEMTGLCSADALGCGWNAALHPDDRERVLREWEAAMRNGAPFRSDYRFLRPDGRVTWVQGMTRAEVDASGRVVSYVGTVIDVTDRKEAEEAAGRSLLKTREELALIADAVPVLISYVGKDGRYVRVNRAYERWFERRREEVEGRHLREVLGEAAYARIRPHVDAAFAGRPSSYEGVLPYRSGGTRYVRAEYTPTRDAAGAVTGYIGLVTDITAAKRGEEALRFLSDAGRVLGSSLDYEATIAKVADLVVGRLCDWCVVDVVEGSRIRRLAVAHRDPRKATWARRLQERTPVDPDAPRGVANVLRTGEPEFYPDVTDELLRQAARSEEHLALLRRADIRSCMIVPMEAAGRVVGVITCVVTGAGRRLVAEDLDLARALAERAALAVENARLYRERTRQKERLQFLADASRLFAESHLDLPELMGRFSHQLVPAFADACHVRRLGEGDRAVRTLAVRHRDPEQERRELDRLAASEPPDGGMAEAVLKGGKPVFLPVVDATAPDRASLERWGVSSYILAPMRAGGAVVGALGLGRGADRDAFTADDLEMAQKVADRAGLALATGDAFEQVRRETEALQRSQEELRGVIDDLTRLHDFSRRVSGQLDVDGVIRDLLSEAARLQGASMGFVELVDPEGPGLRVAASVGHRPEAAERIGLVPIAEGQGACGTAGARRERVVVEDVETDPVFASFRGFARWAGFRAVWSVPMIGRGGELLGVLSTHFPAPRRPSPHEIHMVELYATQAAHLIENARLVSDARRAEEETRRLNAGLEARVRERTATLQEALRELETFSYSVAHDLRAPLRAMEGFGQILLESYAAQLDDAGRDMVRRICAAGVRMDRMVQDLLAYSRLSREEFVLAPVDLEAAVDDALAQMESAVAGAGAVVDVQRPLPQVRGNAVMLAQVVANLLSNAVKFVAEGVRPSVRIWADRETGGRVRLWIEDNGIGIAREHQARIFRVFERLHGASAYAGTGIGLAIVRRALERMGGSVGVESEPGRGSRFWIALELARP